MHFFARLSPKSCFFVWVAVGVAVAEAASNQGTPESPKKQKHFQVLTANKNKQTKKGPGVYSWLRALLKRNHGPMANGQTRALGNPFLHRFSARQGRTSVVNAGELKLHTAHCLRAPLTAPELLRTPPAGISAGRLDVRQPYWHSMLRPARHLLGQWEDSR